VTRTRAGRSAALQRNSVALAVASCFASVPAFGNPSGGQVKSGSATFQQSGNVLQITNSPNAIIHWQGFSIGQGEVTRFVQQSGASAVLNRVVGANPSSILGTLQSNGRVFLINPNGIVFGAGATVDVAGLVASTLNLTDADFIAGRLRFGAQPGAGNIVNEGAITTASGGQVYLIAPNVANSGVITSPKGEVVIAAGRTVEMADARTPLLRVEVSAPENEAVNVGKVLADGGRVSVYGTVIRNKGEIRANTLVRGENGEILLKAKRDVSLEKESVITASGASAGKITIEAEAGNAQVAGKVEANATAGAGGTIQVQAQRDITVDAQALVTANGSSGGQVTIQSAQGTAKIAGRIEANAIASSPPGGGGVAQSAAAVGGKITIAAPVIDLTGTLKAEGAGGGQVTLQANTLTQSGAIGADSVTGKGGTVDLRAGDSAVLAETATISAASVSGDGGEVSVTASDAGSIFSSASFNVTAGGRGGTITVTAREVEVRAGTIDASGDSGGGLIRLGGDLQGKGPLPNARTLTVQRAVRIRADARKKGDGGRVILWSDEHTRFLGEISARGGPLGGNGGFAEVSGKGFLGFDGKIDLLAPLGNTGTLLLDPVDITVFHQSGLSTISNGGTFSPGTTPSSIADSTINNTLITSNVVIQTSGGSGGQGDITFFDGQRRETWTSFSTPV
jgi:filamentous hemagglutinin family protein